MASSTTLAPSAAPVAIATSSVTGRRLIDTKGFTAILNKRITVNLSDVGSQLVLSVQGDGQFLPQGYEYPSTDGQGLTANMFDRWIFNVKANSELSMRKPENRLLLKEALKAESAGDAELASEKFNAFLNAIQISFSVIQNPGVNARKFSSGDQIKAVIGLVDTKAGNKQLVLEDVSLKPAVVKAKSTYAITDLIDLDEEDDAAI